jgi:putative methionine-R-sulfoxide reductase with GAF domain
VLAGVVRLLSDASAVHACFVYLLDQDARRLVLRAASEPYAQYVGRIELKRGEGLAWWALRKGETAFIREKALEDPRVKYVPELEEERFQSLVAVPLLGRRGDPIGAITLDTEAPREFTESEVELLVASASLVAGAIENASLFDEMRRRVGELEQLTGLAEAVARADTVSELGAEVVQRGRELLDADAVCLYLLDADDDRLSLAYTAPDEVDAPATIGLTEVGSGLSRRSGSLTVSLVAGRELLGALVASGTYEVDLARAVANQAAVALKKIQVLEHLTEKNLIRDFFDDLVAGRGGEGLRAKVARLGCDLSRPHLVVVAENVGEPFERALRSIARGAMVDRREHGLRGLVPLPAGDTAHLLGELGRVREQTADGATVGVSTVAAGEAAIAQAFEEARNALAGASVMGRKPGVVSYEELGAYKYLLRIARDPAARDSTIAAVAKLAQYDRERNTSLLLTLEEYLRRHGNISATSEALFVHPNTLRQRLRRIGDLTGLDLRRDDWLMVEIAVKLVRLEAALAAVTAGT